MHQPQASCGVGKKYWANQRALFEGSLQAEHGIIRRHRMGNLMNQLSSHTDFIQRGISQKRCLTVSAVGTLLATLVY